MLPTAIALEFTEALQSAFQQGHLHLSGNLALLRQPHAFASWLRPLFRKNWVVYCKPPFGGPEYVLQYLGRYTHRVAISNHRLVSFTDGQITFRWRDSAHHNTTKLMTLPLDEFLRRFLLHLLPKGFVRIRHFGWLANRRRAQLLPLCLAALNSLPAPSEPETSHSPAIQPSSTLSQLWRTHGGDRETHGGTDPDAFSTQPGYGRPMKRLSTSPKPCVLRGATPSRAFPLNQSLVGAISTSAEQSHSRLHPHSVLAHFLSARNPAHRNASHPILPFVQLP